MVPNLMVLAACALIPFLVAFVWYSPKVFGGDNWAKLIGLTPEQAATPVKPLKLALSILLNFLIAFGLFSFSIHQFSILGLLGGNAELLKTGTAAAFMAEHGGNFLTASHGMVHAIIATIVFVVPMVGYNTIFERRSAKYFFVNVGFWLISLVLMGIVIAKWGAVPV